MPKIFMPRVPTTMVLPKTAGWPRYWRPGQFYPPGSGARIQQVQHSKGIPLHEIGCAIFRVEGDGRAPGIAAHLIAPNLLAGFFIQRHKQTAAHPGRPGDGEDDKILYAALAKSACGLHAPGNSGNGIAEIAVYPFIFTCNGVDFKDGGICQLEAAAGRPVQACPEIEVGRAVFQGKDGRAVSIICYILRPDDAHGVQIDAQERSAVIGDIQVVFPDDGAIFHAKPVALFSGARGLIAQLDNLLRVDAQLAIPSYAGIEPEGIEDAVFAGLDDGI